jgi:hypothetical protein
MGAIFFYQTHFLSVKFCFEFRHENEFRHSSLIISHESLCITVLLRELILGNRTGANSNSNDKRNDK